MADVEKALGASGPVAMTGYVFSESFAAAHKNALKRFFAAAAEAQKILAQDPSAWAPIKARLRLKDDAALEVYRQRYLDGVPKRSVAEEAADARRPLSPAHRDRRQGARRRRQGARRQTVLRSRDRRIRRDDAAHLALRAHWLWQIAAHFGNPRLLPGPMAVFATMKSEAASGALFVALGATLARVAAAFLLAMAAGIGDRLCDGTQRAV